MKRGCSRVIQVILWCAVVCVATSPAATQDNTDVLSASALTVEPIEAAEEAAPDDVDIMVSPRGEVDLHARQAHLANVLQMLSMQSRRNIVASPSVGGVVTANLYGVTLEEALTAILDGNGCAWREQGRFIYVYTKAELIAIELAGQPVETRVVRLRYARAEDVQLLIRDVLSDTGTVAVTPAAEAGIAPSSESAGGQGYATDDCLVITDMPDRIQAVESVIREIDVRPKQVLIEATLLRATLNEQNEVGIDFNVVGGVDFRNLSATSTGVQDLTLGELPERAFDNTSLNTSTDFASNVSDGGFTFGLISNNIGVFIRALEQVTDVAVMANPKILALNKHRGEMIVGRRDGYLTTTVTETAAVENVEFLETGTRLIFRPFITDDGYIRMEVHPEDSSGGITAANLPFEQTTEVTTNVLVKDGHTILIGGLFREVTTAGRNQVPLLGNIPIAGALVRNTDDNTEREEVIILLTVHIIKDDDTYAEVGAELLQDVERYRVGMREGLQWHGRERLSQAHYHWAQEHLAKGHVSKALWDLNLAINNNPKLISAIKLKEKLLDQRRWDDDSSRLRGFVIEQIMRQEGVATPLFGRPAPASGSMEMIGPNGFEDDPDDGTKEGGAS